MSAAVVGIRCLTEVPTNHDTAPAAVTLRRRAGEDRPAMSVAGLNSEQLPDSADRVVVHRAPAPRAPPRRVGIGSKPPRSRRRFFDFDRRGAVEQAIQSAKRLGQGMITVIMQIEHLRLSEARSCSWRCRPEHHLFMQNHCVGWYDNAQSASASGTHPVGGRQITPSRPIE